MRAARIVPPILAILAVLSSAGPADSTTLLRLSLDTLSRDAVMVVQGHVSWDYAARPDPDAPPYTYTGIEVTRCVAGSCPETVVLRHRGGNAGGTNLFIPGMPRFAPGQEVLLFLRDDYEEQAGYFSVLGMVQGFFLVIEEPASGRKIAVQQLGAVTLASPDANGSITPTGPGVPIIEDLEALVGRIVEMRAKKGGAE